MKYTNLMLDNSLLINTEGTLKYIIIYKENMFSKDLIYINL